MLKRPHFALNPARTLVARAGGYLQVELWWADRSDKSPICELPVFGAGLGGLHFPSDRELWILGSDGELASWDVATLIEQSERASARAPKDAPVPESASEPEADESSESSESEADPSTPETESADAIDAKPQWRMRIDADVSVVVGADRFFAVGDRKGRVWLIEAHPTGAHVRQGVEQHTDAVMALAFSRGGLSLASSGRDRVIRTWRSADAGGLSESSAVSASEVLEFFSVATDSAGPEPEPQIADSDDDVSGEDEERAEPAPVDESTGPRPAPLQAERRLVGLEGWQITLAFSPDGGRLASGGMDQGLYLWDLAAEDDRPQHVQFAHSGWIADLDWSSDGSAIATASWDCTIGLFDGRTLEPRVCLELHRDYVSDVEFVGQRLVAASHDGEISVWSWATSELDFVLTGHTDWVEAVVSLGRQEILSVASDRTTRVWSLESEKEIRALGALDDISSFEIGAPVDMGAYVDLSGLASYGRDPEPESRRYRDYRASGFRTTTEKTALGLLEGAIETAIPEPPDATAEVELSVEQLRATAATIETVAAPDPIVAAPAPEPEPESEPKSSIEVEPDPTPEVDSAPEPERAAVDALSDAEDSYGRDDTQVAAVPPMRGTAQYNAATASAAREKIEDVWRREPSIGTTTIRRLPPVSEDGTEPAEPSISGSAVITSFNTADDSGELPLTMGLGDEPSERFDPFDPQDAPFEAFADPPSDEMGHFDTAGQMSEGSVDDEWEELEQMVDPSMFRTHSWPKPIVEDEHHLPSQTGEWDVSFDESSAAVSTMSSEVIPDDFTPARDEVTAELPAAQVAELRARSDAVSQTGSHEIWERLPSRATPRDELLTQRAAPGASRFALNMRIKTPHEFVYGIAIAPDGKSLATCGGDNSLCVWNRKGELLHRVRIDGDGLNAVDFSFDGRAIAAGGDDRIVHLWLLPPADDPSFPIEHATLRGHDGWIADLCFSPDGSFVLTGSYDGTARVWKLSTGQCVRTLAGHEGAVSGVAIGTTRAVTVGHDGTARVWNQSWTQIDQLGGHERLLAISTNGSSAAYCAASGEVFRVLDGRPVEIGRHDGQARAVLVRGDGVTFSTGEDAAVRIYAEGGTAPIQTLMVPSPVWCVDARRDIFAVGADDGYVYVFSEA